jgi:hypothetical protein
MITWDEIKTKLWGPKLWVPSHLGPVRTRDSSAQNDTLWPIVAYIYKLINFEIKPHLTSKVHKEEAI